MDDASLPASLKAIHAAEDVQEAKEKALRNQAARTTHVKGGRALEGGVQETLAYYAFPEEHWRRIRTNNPLERILLAQLRLNARREAETKTLVGFGNTLT